MPQEDLEDAFSSFWSSRSNVLRILQYSKNEKGQIDSNLATNITLKLLRLYVKEKIWEVYHKPRTIVNSDLLANQHYYEKSFSLLEANEIWDKWEDWENGTEVVP